MKKVVYLLLFLLILFLAKAGIDCAAEQGVLDMVVTWFY